MTEGRTSGESVRLDPFDFWRQVYESNEQAWTKTMKDVITSEGYAESQGKMLESFLMVQKMMREGMSAQLNGLNIPTRDDVARLGELLLSVEEKVDMLEDRFSGMDAHLARQKSIEERLAGLDERLAQQSGIEGRLASMDAHLASQSRVGERLAGLDEWLARQKSIEERLVRLDERLARQMPVVERVANDKGGPEVGPAETAGSPAGHARPAPTTRRKASNVKTEK